MVRQTTSSRWVLASIVKGDDYRKPTGLPACRGVQTALSLALTIWNRPLLPNVRSHCKDYQRNPVREGEARLV